MPLSYLDGKPLKYTGTVRVAREDLDRDAIDGSILDMVREARAVRERAARPAPPPAAGPWRCHVCTLAAGTCEHSPHWFARRVADARRAKDAKLDAARLEVARAVHDRAGQESEIPNFKGSCLGRFPLVSADFWTSDHLSERSRSVDAFPGTRARGRLTLKRR